MRTRLATSHEHGWWRLLSPLVFVCGGVLFVASSISSGGTDLRPERYDTLADLALSRSDRVSELTAQASRLQADIDQLTAALGSPELKQMQTQLDLLRAETGMSPVTGPGVTVTLDDAPERVLQDGNGDISRKIVHQQDIQAVANALLAAGAEAVTVQGQRIVSTTGIKCVGSSVLLQGIAYPPPYVISGIGDSSQLRAGLTSDDYLKRYRSDAATYQLTWKVESEVSLSFPAYDGPVDATYARELG